MVDQNMHGTKTSPAILLEAVTSQSDNDEKKPEFLTIVHSIPLNTDPTPPVVTLSPDQDASPAIIPPPKTPSLTTKPTTPTRKSVEAPFIDRTLQIRHLITHSTLTFLSALASIIIELGYALDVANLDQAGGEMQALVDLWYRIKQYNDIAIRDKINLGGNMYEEFERVEVNRGWLRENEEEKEKEKKRKKNKMKEGETKESKTEEWVYSDAVWVVVLGLLCFGLLIPTLALCLVIFLWCADH